MRHPVLSYLKHNNFLATILLIVFGLFLLEIKEVLIGLFISYILMASLSPAVVWLTKYKIPQFLATFIVFFLALAGFFTVIFPLFPFLIAQMQQLFKTFPLYADRTSELLGIPFDYHAIQTLFSSELGSISQNAFAVTKSVFSGLFSVLSILVITLYMLLDQKHMRKAVVSFFPKYAQEKTFHTMTEIEQKLGAWLRGQIVLSFFIGSLTWVVLTLLHIPFALPLALLAGILEIVPTLGPILSAIPAVIVAFAISPTLSLVVALVYIGIQLLENNLLVPKIMEKAVGLNPIVIIVSVAIGAKLLGIIGALLAIPFLSVLIIVVRAVNTKSE